MGLSHLKSQRRGFPASAVALDHCSLYSGIGGHSTDKEPHQSYTGNWELGCMRQERSGSYRNNY